MFKNILVPIDLEADEAPDRVLNAVARLSEESAIVRLLYVVHTVPPLVSQFLPEDFEQKTSVESLNRLKKTAKQVDLGGRTLDFVVRHGDVYREILQAADEEESDLIALSSHQPGMEDYLLGSNAARVVRHSKCTVLILR